MSKKYTQLSLIQKYQTEAFIKAGMKRKMIAANIGVDSSTVSRELSRNIANRDRTASEYVASNAQRKTDHRHLIKHKDVKFSTEMKESRLFDGFLMKNGVLKSLVLRATKPVNVQ
jgi:IS30 family transposase